MKGAHLPAPAANEARLRVTAMAPYGAAWMMDGSVEAEGSIHPHRPSRAMELGRAHLAPLVAMEVFHRTGSIAVPMKWSENSSACITGDIASMAALPDNAAWFPAPEHPAARTNANSADDRSSLFIIRSMTPSLAYPSGIRTAFHPA